MTSMIRVFFAIDLPEPVKKKLGMFISALKKKSRSHQIRWARVENLHITLQFLAKVHPEDISQLIENVRAELRAGIKNATIQFGAPRLFPNPYHPRVIVLDVLPQEELAMLSGLIGQGIKASHYDVEDRPFRAHLTLGRIKHPQGVKLDFLRDLPQSEMETIDVDEVVLFQSEPHPEGSHYTPLERLAFRH